MKIFWKWILKNLSYIFSFTGIILTLYFGVFYVPTWLREAQNEKNLNAQRNLQQSIKELIYSDSICSYSEIEALIRAKEISLNQEFPFSPLEVLIQIQESFMQDRFLPLEKRKKLISELEKLKKEIPETTIEYTEKSKAKNSIWIYEWLSILVSLIAVIVGIISFFLKFKTEKEKDEEIENQIIESDNYKSNIEFAIDYEKQIINTIAKYPEVKIIKQPGDRDFGLDLEFDFKGKRYFVEAKYLSRSKVGLNSFQRFLAYQKGLEGEFWFIYNTDLTDMVKSKAETMNKISSPNRIITLIKAENGNDLLKQMVKLLPTTKAHT